MELKQFIKEALLNIVNGVEEANKSNKRFKIIGIKHHESGMDGNYADFDVSVIASESSGNEIDGKVNGQIGTSLLSVVSANIDSSVTAKTDQANLNQNAHRLTFKIFISENEIK